MRVAVAAALLLGPLAQAATAAPCAAVKRHGAWTEIAVPGGAAARFAVAAAAGGRDVLYVTDGRSVRRSADGGCTWSVALSLDTALPQDEANKAAAAYTFASVAVSPSRGGAPGTVWALATARTQGIEAVAFPAATFESRDGGRTWRRHHEPDAGPAGDYPRCTGQSRIMPGPDAGTAYLFCEDAALATVFAVWVHCRASFHVTRDYAATWQPVFPRWADPDAVAAGDTQTWGCAPTGWNVPNVDRAARRVVWGTASNAVLRSTDDGRSMKPFATVSEFGQWVQWSDGGTLRNGRPVTLIIANAELLYSTGGPAKKLPSLPMKVSERGAPVSGAVLHGTDDLFVAYSGGDGKASAWLFDVPRARWRKLPAPPRRADRTEAWNSAYGGAVEVAGDPVTPYLYLRAGSDGRVLRYALR